LGSCLPLLLQLPVFISLYYMLRQSLRVDICPAIQRAHNGGVLSKAHTVPCGAGHGAGFLFIPDLTDKASGVVLVVLILLYVGSQLGSTLVMSSASTMDPMQRRLMMFLPLVFVLFVFRFPAGVLVYWITTNFWTMGQQYVVRQRVGPRMAVAGAGDIDGAVSKPKGSGPRSGPTAAKALPKAPADTVKGNGEKAAAAGGIAALFRGRGQPAQVADKTDVATNGTSGSSPKADPKSDSPARASSSAAKTRSRPGSNRGSAKASGSAKGSGGSTKASGGSAKASGTAKSSGNGSADSSSPVDGVKPPPPPRKRKKRSGRRR
jgi:YidC/Oxa1 family membrane protein insertase